MLTTRAFAKVNLDLRVTGRRPDGYHTLETVFQAVALADVLTLRPATGAFVCTCDAPALPTGPENLAVRAARAVAEALGRPLDGWRLHLEKHVPAEAGLGGGSADAVAAARLVLAAHGERWPAARLAALLAPLGADVPFFVEGGTVLGRGRGDELAVLPDLPPHGVLLARPAFGVSTAEAYGWFASAPPPPPAPPLVLPGDAAAWPAFLARCRNDLQPAVVARHPALRDGLSRLEAAGAGLALMSGSGSAIFGLFADLDAACRAAMGWPDGWRCWPTTTLGRAAYRRGTGVEGADDPSHPLSESPTLV